MTAGRKNDPAQITTYRASHRLIKLNGLINQNADADVKLNFACRLWTDALSVDNLFDYRSVVLRIIF